MENNDKAVKKKNGVITKNINDIIQNLPQWTKNITVIDLREKNLNNIDDNVTFPPRLIELNVSHNQLSEVPMTILDLEYLKILDLSFNAIKYFDDTPNFCHTIERLDLSHNSLEGPPYWIFSDTPEKLRELYLSNNSDITKSLDETYVKRLLQFDVLVTELHIFNCRLEKYMLLLKSFSKIKTLFLGTLEYCHKSANMVLEIPCRGLDNCCDIEKLNLCNTNIHTVTSNIHSYRNLIELDLSENNITNLPNEFCELTNLEICILSYNKLLYLPDEMYKLNKIKVLHVDHNELCMIFENLHQLHKLQSLDLYDNQLYDIPDLTDNLEELDLALNYFEEPDDHDYLLKKAKLRHNTARIDGRKPEVIRSGGHSDITTDEELNSIISTNVNDSPEPENRPSSSPEDWDSDDYWIPLYDNNVPPPLSPWHYFVKQKIEEGNFCPIDMHPVSIAEKVKYEKLCNPQETHESDGQFDDFSDDDT